VLNIVEDWQKGQKTSREPVPTPREFVSTSVGQAYATAAKVLPEVHRVRTRFFGDAKPPFACSPEGHEQALEWLRKAQREDEAALEGRRPGRVNISVVLETDDVPKTSDAFRPLLSIKASDSVAEWHRLLADAIAQVLADSGCKALSWATPGGYEGNELYPMLEMSDGKGWRDEVRAFAKTRLAELAEGVKDIAKASGWWSELEALNVIMCNTLPFPGVHVTAPLDFAFDDKYEGLFPVPAITLTVRGPTAEQEVLKRYRQVLKDHGLKPKPLSTVHSAVLELVFKTPGETWAQRYERWKEWCSRHAHLPTYTEKNGAASLSTEYRRALKRAAWK
jgi:hypothetical protein